MERHVRDVRQDDADQPGAPGPGLDAMAFGATPAVLAVFSIRVRVSSPTMCRDAGVSA